MKLEEIGFYTLSDERVKASNSWSPLYRCEMVLTGRCNLRCPYCRGLPSGFDKDINIWTATHTLLLWGLERLKNVRFSGGEPMLYPHIEELVKYSKKLGTEHIAVSTNGTIAIDRYLNLIKCGVNDFSISLDAGCCSVGDVMSGVCGAWDKAANTIRKLSKETYVSVGVVFTESNVETAVETINFIDSLGPADIRVIPSAQWNKAIESLKKLPEETLNKYPILKYRINNMESGRNIRGIGKDDYNRCPIALDDVAVCNGYHFPCIIYLREHGNPIGKMDPMMRHDRVKWFLNHDTYKDRICRENCIDCVVDYNNKWKSFHGNEYKFAKTAK